MLAVGDKAPLFVAPGSDGEVDLAALLKGGPVVLCATRTWSTRGVAFC